MPSIRAPKVDWTRQQLLAVLHLYTQMPFGQLDARNAKVKQLAIWQGRSPNSVAMKLTNLSSLDPVIVARGLSGLRGASALDRAVWNEFHENWAQMSAEAEREYARLAALNGAPLEELDDEVDELPRVIAEGKTRSAIVNVRVNQWKFRKSIIANYRARCCISGLENTQLLNASHIVPWSDDHKNRMNPQNGLCLSALHDRAFDLGLLTVMPDFRVRVSKALKTKTANTFLQDSLLRFDNEAILMPARYGPDPRFLESHARRFGFIK